MVIFDRKMGSRACTLRGLDAAGSRPPVLMIIRTPIWKWQPLTMRHITFLTGAWGAPRFAGDSKHASTVTFTRTGVRGDHPLAISPWVIP